LPAIEISISELLDRLSILEVKLVHLKSATQKQYVRVEIGNLRKQADDILDNSELKLCYDEVLRLNQAMWNAMERLYTWVGPRDTEFQEIVIAIVEVNKERAIVKRQVDVLVGSSAREAKSFFEDDPPALK